MATFSQSVNGTVSFSGAAPKQTAYPLQGVLNFTGTLRYLVAYLLTAVLSFTGGLLTGRLHPGNFFSLTAALSFSGKTTKTSGWVLTGGLSFGGALKRSILVLLTGGLAFTGGVLTSIARLLSAGLALTGSLTRTSLRAFRAGLSFTGRIGRLIGQVFVANILTSTGSGGTAVPPASSLFPSSDLLPQGVPVGKLTRQTTHLVTGTLLVSGRIGRSIVHTVVGQFSPTGVIRRSSTMLLTVSHMSFIGQVVKRTARAYPGHLGFTGHVNRAIGQTLQAALSFTGSVGKRLQRTLRGVLSFFGSFGAQQTVWAQTVSGSVGFHSRFEAVAAVDTIYQPVTPTYLGVYPDELLVAMPDFQFLLVPVEPLKTVEAPNNPMRTK